MGVSVVSQRWRAGTVLIDEVEQDIVLLDALGSLHDGPPLVERGKVLLHLVLQLLHLLFVLFGLRTILAGLGWISQLLILSLLLLLGED